MQTAMELRQKRKQKILSMMAAFNAETLALAKNVFEGLKTQHCPCFSTFQPDMKTNTSCVHKVPRS